MPCAHCIDADREFDERTARRELRRLLRRGPPRSTRLLIDALRARGRSLLDIGGGVGAVQHALAEEGARITGVDASHAYLAVARGEAERRGYADRATYRFGDFVELADELPPHDVVTLDRVLCCYPDLDALVTASTARAEQIWAAVFPKDRWWMRWGVRVLNAVLRMRGSDFRAYVHPESQIEALALRAGLVPERRAATWLWNVQVWVRPAPG